MAIVIDQNIPSEMFDRYNKVLTPAYSNPTAPGVGIVQPNGGPIFGVPPSAAQLKVRQAFKDSCACWWKQKEEGTSWPPDIGPRDIIWWSLESEYWEMMIFHYYMYLTISPFYNEEQVDWCVYGPKRDVHVCSLVPDLNLAFTEKIFVNTSYGDPIYRFFIMKDEDEYDYTYLHIYCTDIWIGEDYQTPIISVWNIRQNFFQELRLTWNDQPYFYDMITYQTVSEEGWVHIYTGTDWHAVGVKIHPNQEAMEEYRFGAQFASMEYPIESLRPYWYS